MRPNILIFCSDQELADLSLLDPGSGGAAMPRTRAFMQEATTFRRAFCPSPHCCPSRATLFSGLYPSRHGVWNNVSTPTAINDGLHPNVRLWSQDLAQAGYENVFAGKWHVSYNENPAGRGWRESIVTARGGGERHQKRMDAYRSLRTGPRAEPRAWGEVLRDGWGDLQWFGECGDEGPFGDHKTIHAALHEIESLGRQSKPWCLWVGPLAPHDPYFAPRKYLEQVPLDSIQLPPSFEDEMSDKPRVYGRQARSWKQFSREESRDCLRHYHAMSNWLDDQFGQVLDALSATNQASSTCVLRLSDHGDYAGAHGLWAKGIAAFREAYHVPLSIRWPDGFQSAQQTDHFASLADLAPTIRELAQVEHESPSTWERSLAPLCRGEEVQWRDEMHSQCQGVELYYTQRSVRTDDWRYTFNGFDEDELYDLHADPHETTNLLDPAGAGRDDYAEVVRSMCARMWRFARREEDAALFNSYATVALAPVGPGSGFGST